MRLLKTSDGQTLSWLSCWGWPPAPAVSYPAHLFGEGATGHGAKSHFKAGERIEVAAETALGI